MKIYILIFIFILKYSYSYAEVKIAYIDVNYILKNSIIGKSLDEHMSKYEKNHLNKFNKIENSLIKKEEDIFLKKNIIDKAEFDEKIKSLKSEIKLYRAERKKSNDQINKIKVESTKKILQFLNPIITNYVDDNSISIVLPKKNIIVGKKNLDITNVIINILNNNVKTIDF